MSQDQSVGEPAHQAILRFPRWLVIVGAGVPCALIAFAASPIGLDILYIEVGAPALLWLWKFTGVCAAILCLYAAVQRQWRRAVAASVLPLVLLVVALDPHKFASLYQYAGNVGRFALMRPFYDARLAGLPTTESPRLAEFDWDGFSSVTFAVVYDDSDQIALPPGRQSAAWLAQVKQQLICGDYGIVQSFWAHYYLVSFPC